MSLHHVGSAATLQQVLDRAGGVVDYLYNDTSGPHSRNRGGLSPVPAEFSNWRDEQLAWRESAILFDQSHHMPELFVSGPDALKLLSHVGINNLTNLSPNRAKQFVGCTPAGHVIGDCVLEDLGDGAYELISGMPLLNWVEYNATIGGYDVQIDRDAATADNATGRRRFFRFQLDGPEAGKIFAEILDGDPPKIPFFNMARVQIAGIGVRALRHGMAGHHGVELSGPFEHGPAVRQVIMDAGVKYGLRPGGTKAYFSTAFESGWIAYPLPAIYTGEDLRAYREWLPATCWEAQFQIGGSFHSPDVEDYYATPWDLGYHKLIDFGHDFIGREALEAMAAQPHRSKVTLVWNTEDVTRVMGSLFDGPVHKHLELPVADYAIVQRDTVRTPGGDLIGLSTLCGYSSNERRFLSLAMVDEEQATPGTEVVLTWGEPGGGSRKSRVERHEQVDIRATVGPAPYASAVRNMKRAGVPA